MIFTGYVCPIPTVSHFMCVVSNIFDTMSGALRLNTRREGPDENYRAVFMPPTLLGSLHPMCLFQRSNGLKHPAGERFSLCWIPPSFQRRLKKRPFFLSLEERLTSKCPASKSFVFLYSITFFSPLWFSFSSSSAS